MLICGSHNLVCPPTLTVTFMQRIDVVLVPHDPPIGLVITIHAAPVRLVCPKPSNVMDTGSAAAVGAGDSQDTCALGVPS